MYTPPAGQLIVADAIDVFPSQNLLIRNANPDAVFIHDSNPMLALFPLPTETQNRSSNYTVPVKSLCDYPFVRPLSRIPQIPRVRHNQQKGMFHCCHIAPAQYISIWTVPLSRY